MKGENMTGIDNEFQIGQRVRFHDSQLGRDRPGVVRGVVPVPMKDGETGWFVSVSPVIADEVSESRYLMPASSVIAGGGR
jgi:hypothetical protein